MKLYLSTCRCLSYEGARGIGSFSNNAMKLGANRICLGVEGKRRNHHLSRKCFKGLIHSTYWGEFPHCIKDFRSGKRFTTIQSRKIKINLWFSQSLNCLNYDWNFYSKKIIVLAFHLDVRTQSFSLLQSYHYLPFNSLSVESDAFFVLHRSWVLQVLTTRMSPFLASLEKLNSVLSLDSCIPCLNPAPLFLVLKIVLWC